MSRHISSSVLYYPFVGLADSPWLTNALLYWEKIYLIVPADVALSDYHLPDSILDLNKRLIDAGVVERVPVSSNSEPVAEASKQFVAQLENNPRIQQVLTQKAPENTREGRIFRQKLGSFDLYSMLGLWRRADRNLFETAFVTADPDGPSSLIELPSALITCYMSLLATQLARSAKLAIGTDSEWRESELWTDVAGNRFAEKRNEEPVKTQEEANGFIVHLILQTVNVENNPIKKVMKFRARYADERKLFRNAIQSVFNDIPEDAREWELSEYFHERWWNVVEPQLNNLRKALRSNKLLTALSLLKAAAYCTPASLFGLTKMGPLGAAIGAAVGTLPIVVEAVTHDADRKASLRSNPLSYVLRLYDEHGKTTRHDMRLGLSIPA